MTEQLNNKILIFEDDPSILEMLKAYFSGLGADILTSADGVDATEIVQKVQPDIVLLDIVLPFNDGISILRNIREASLQVPVILLTEKNSVDDKVLGLDSGADDYLCKPFSLKELLSRVKANLRRVNRELTPSTSLLTFSQFTVNQVTREVKSHQGLIPLTKTEFELLTVLAGKPSEVIHYDELYVDVLGYTPEAETKALVMHVMNLRRKLKTHGIFECEIQAVAGVGYRFIQLEKSPEPKHATFNNENSHD